MTDKNREIEELTTFVCNLCRKRSRANCAKDKRCDVICREAKDIYNAGYRKQREGEWRMVKYPLCECTNCHKTRNCENDTGWKFCPECGATMMKGESK